VVFHESVSIAQIQKYADDIEANGMNVSFCSKPNINPSYRIGGKVKDRYYESAAGIRVRLKAAIVKCDDR